MTTRRSADSEGVRSAISHVKVLERIHSPKYGDFTLVEVSIETGRTHQIRVHLQALGHPVVGDTLYGAPHFITLSKTSSPNEVSSRPKQGTASPSLAKRRDPRISLEAPATLAAGTISLDRNFLHAARLAFTHPQTRKALQIESPLPTELSAFLSVIRADSTHS
jgi:23S rRNA pseudouridine1911/1915/1917 synthase